MVLELTKITNTPFECSIQSEPLQKMHRTEPHFSDVLCFDKDKSLFDTVFAKGKQVFLWLYQGARDLFFKLISCFGCFQTEAKRQLKIFKEDLPKVQELEKQFPDKASRVDEKQLKEWWKTQVESLDPEVQTMLLIEDIRLRKPAHIQQDEEEWARANLEEWRTLATEYVIKLNKETINARTHYPLDDVPDYLTGLRETLEAKIKEAETAK